MTKQNKKATHDEVQRPEQIELRLSPELEIALEGAINRAARKIAVNNRYPIYLSKKQACKYLNISNKTLNDWIDTGDIPYKHIGNTYRFNRDDLDAFMAAEQS